MLRVVRRSSLYTQALLETRETSAQGLAREPKSVALRG